MDDWLIERSVQAARIRVGKSIEVINPRGDVRCRRTDDQQTEVRAVVQRSSNDSRSLPVVQLTHPDGGLRVEVIYDPAQPSDPDFDKRRVDLVLYIPDSSPLVVRANDGLIEAKGLHGDVDLVARGSSSIVVSTLGSVTARSEEGSIFATLERAQRGESRLDSYSGEIRAVLSSFADANVSARTTGDLVTDFSVSVSYPESDRRKSVRLVLGPQVSSTKGGESQKLTISSELGVVHLQRATDWGASPDIPGAADG